MWKTSKQHPYIEFDLLHKNTFTELQVSIGKDRILRVGWSIYVPASG